MASAEHLRASLQENRDLWITAATYDSLRGYNCEERFTQVMSANDVCATLSVAHWRHEVANSARDRASGSEGSSKDLRDKKAQAFYLRAALLHLLDLVDAPVPFKVDVREFLNVDQPTKAIKRGEVQAVLIDFPHLAADPAALAKAAKCSRRLVERYLDDGSVQPMP